jgi:hypothetical protein
MKKKKSLSQKELRGKPKLLFLECCRGDLTKIAEYNPISARLHWNVFVGYSNVFDLATYFPNDQGDKT